VVVGGTGELEVVVASVLLDGIVVASVLLDGIVVASVLLDGIVVVSAVLDGIVVASVVLDGIVVSPCDDASTANSATEIPIANNGLGTRIFAT
jgi:hypothetical protein